MTLDNTNQLTVLGVTNLNLPLNPSGVKLRQSAAPTNAPPAASSTNGIPEIL